MLRAADLPHWRAAGRALVAKALGELQFEGLLEARPDGDAYAVALPDGVAYRFPARVCPFGGLRVDAARVERVTAAGAQPADDPLQLLLDARRVLGLGGAELADAIREMTATQAADARLRRDLPTAAQLADLGHVDLEAHGPGHPRMVLNKGRLGFSASDAERYAPESRPDVRLRWVACDPALARHHGLDRRALAARVLDPATAEEFARRLGSRRGDWAWLPVHPFHWDEAIAPLFAGELARGRIVELGTAPDAHRPLQSVRTLANVARPDRFDVKLPLAIRNTLVWRGLAPAPSAAAPQISAWLQGVAARDPFLRDETRMVVLGEVASVVGRHPTLAAVPDAPYRFAELFGAVFRQPVAGLLRDGERARTMAALTWVGSDGRALAAELVRRSGLEPVVWLDRFLGALLPPLLHWLVRHGVAFCPHGENVVVLFDAADVPVGIAVKDLAEDVNLLPGDEHPELGPEAEAVLHRWPPSDLRHALLSAVFAGHFRDFGDVVERHLGVPEDRFWQRVGGVVDEQLERLAPWAERAAALDLRAPRFERICLNREQLLGDGFHERAERDEGFDLTEGTVANPLVAAAWR